MDARTLFLENLELVDRVIAGACRRHALYDADADDFASWAKARLLANDYEVIRKFEERSSFSTYLVVVITNLLRDYNVQRWGRWRPSAEAKRLGAVAVRLEQLVHRDGHSVPEAIGILRSREPVSQSDRELAVLAARLPGRRRPREVGEEPLWNAPAPERADAGVEQAEQAEAWDTVRAALAAALDTLPAEDRLILRLRFWENHSVADIARTLGLEQKPLYRRIERRLTELKGRLQGAGVDRGAFAELLQGAASE